MPGDTVLDVDVLDFTFDVTCDVTVDVVTDETVVEVVGISVVEGCTGEMVTPGLKHCTLIGEFSVKCTRWKHWHQKKAGMRQVLLESLIPSTVRCKMRQLK